MSKPIVIRLPSGEEYGVASFAAVEKHYPDAEVIAYQDGSEYNGKQVPVVQERLDAEAEERRLAEEEEAKKNATPSEDSAPPEQTEPPKRGRS